MTNLPIAAIMIVFAGGPHTPERTTLACELLASRPLPAVIYLTGAEYQGEYSNQVDRIRKALASRQVAVGSGQVAVGSGQWAVGSECPVRL
ncbi:MAG: hypothetical protein WCS52_18425 [bacterium]